MSERELIFNKTNGHCYYCGGALSKGWHVDHFHPLRRIPQVERNEWDKITSVKYTDEVCENPEHDCFDNKVPSCPRCNRRKDVFTIEQFREEIAAQVERLQRDSNQFRLAADFGLIGITNSPVVFYFETIMDTETKDQQDAAASDVEAIVICRFCKNTFERSEMVINPMNNSELVCLDCQRDINEDAQMMLGDFTGLD